MWVVISCSACHRATALSPRPTHIGRKWEASRSREHFWGRVTQLSVEVKKERGERRRRLCYIRTYVCTYVLSSYTFNNNTKLVLKDNS